MRMLCIANADGKQCAHALRLHVSMACMQLEEQLRNSLVLVDVDIPLVALSDGVHARSFAGNGVVVFHGKRVREHTHECDCMHDRTRLCACALLCWQRLGRLPRGQAGVCIAFVCMCVRSCVCMCVRVAMV